MGKLGTSHAATNNPWVPKMVEEDPEPIYGQIDEVVNEETKEEEEVAQPQSQVPEASYEC